MFRFVQFHLCRINFAVIESGASIKLNSCPSLHARGQEPQVELVRPMVAMPLPLLPGHLRYETWIMTTAWRWNPTLLKYATKFGLLQPRRACPFFLFLFGGVTEFALPFMREKSDKDFTRKATPLRSSYFGD